MRYVEFKDYELLDAANGEKLERWGDIILIRPEPQAIWTDKKAIKLWSNPHAIYHRSNSGGGYWEMIKKVPDSWSINYKNLVFNLKPMGFKHTGLFPEQAVNWDFIIKNTKPSMKVLNLFAYTGAATIAALSTGANVTHVDASKGMTMWAKENASSSNLSQNHVRWLVDDCIKFIKREIRRGNKYDAIIMDPPSYGRGPGGEVFKIEDKLEELLNISGQLLSDNSKYFLLNTYTAGLSQTILNYMVKKCVIKEKFFGEISTDEIGIKATYRVIVLPWGNTTIWKSDVIE